MAFFDALLAFIRSVEEVHSWWYGVLLDENDPNSLAGLLGLTNDELLGFLKKAGLVTMRNNNPMIQMDIFENLVKNACALNCPAEVQRSVYGTTRDSKKRKMYFLRIGKCTEDSPPNPRSLHDYVKPHRQNSNLLRSARKVLRDVIAQELLLPAVGGATPTTPAAVEKTRVISPEDTTMSLPGKPDATLLRETLARHVIHSTDEELVIHIIDLGDQYRQQREKSRSRKLFTDVLPSDKIASIQTPTLTEYGIRKEHVIESRVLSALLLDIIAVNRVVPEELLDISPWNGKTARLVHVPASKDFNRIALNDSKSGWISRIIACLVPEYDEDEQNEACSDHAIRSLLAHLSRKFRTQFLHVARNDVGLPIVEPMSEVQTFAMLSQANVNVQQRRVITRHLLQHCGASLFASEKRTNATLGGEFIEPKTARFQHGNERIEWSYKDAVKTFKMHMKDVINGENEVSVNHVDVVLSIDHGQGASRATMTIIRRTMDHDGAWREDEDSFSIADAICRKDNRSILLGTFANEIERDMQTINEWKYLKVFSRADDEDKVYAVLGPIATPMNVEDVEVKTIPINLFFAADLAMAFMSCGREDFSSHWCAWCTLSRKEWQPKDHVKGDPWTLAKLEEALQKVVTLENSGKTPTSAQRQGVASAPLFSSFDLPQYITPLLHCELGAGNNGFNSFVSEAQAACEEYSQAYVQLETNLLKAKAAYVQARDEKKHTTDALRQRKTEIKESKDEDATLDDEDIAILNLELSEIQSTIKLLSDDAKNKKKEQDDAKGAFEEETKKKQNTKTYGQPVRAMLERLLQDKFAVRRGVFHGGDFQGEAVRGLMSKREEIFKLLKENLLDLPEEQKYFDDDTITQMSDLHERLFGHMDAFFSLARTKRFHLMDAMIDRAEKHVEHILHLWRYLGLSVTPKIHCIEDHIIPLLRKLRGIGDLGEDAGERAHQIIARFEARSKGMRSIKPKAIFQAKQEMMVKNPDVKKHQELVKENAKRKYKDPDRKSKMDNDGEKKMRRNEKRINLFDIPLPTAPYNSLKKRKTAKMLSDANHSLDS